MKVFGKIAVALLSLSFCFSAFGCADLTNPDLGGNSGSNSGGEQEQTQVGDTLLSAIIGQLEEANTLTFSLELKTTQNNVYKAEEKKADSYFDEENFSYDFTIAKTETGYDMMISGTRTEYTKIGEDGEIKTNEQNYASYVIDGVTYTYDEYYDYDGYTYNPYENSTAELPDLSAVADSFKTEEIEAFKKMLGDALTEVYNVTEGSISFAYDGKDNMNALFDYLGEIDVDTKTVESVIDDVLALTDEELTVEAILAEVEALDTKTVGDALEAIDEYLTETADTTLQGLKDELIADERIVALLKDQAGMTDVDIENIKSFVIEQGLAQYKSVLLDQLVFEYVILPMMGADENYTYEAFLQDVVVKTAGAADSAISYLVGSVKPTLAMTLAQTTGEDEVALEKMKEAFNVCKYITVNDFSADMNVEFDQYFQLETMSANGNMEMVKDDETVTSTEIASFTLSIDSISKEVTEIALPEDAKLVFAFWQNDVILENNTGVTLLVPDYNAETGEYTNVNGFLYPYSTSDYVAFTYEVPTEVTNTWEITVTDIYLNETYYSGVELETLLDGDLTYTLTFDFEGTGNYITDFVMPVV